MDDRQRVIALNRQAAAESKYEKAVAQYLRMADWLEQSSGPLPENATDWLCGTCEAGPGDACEFETYGPRTELFDVESLVPKEPRFHPYRGWKIGSCEPGDRWRGGPMAAEGTVPVHAATMEEAAEAHRGRCLCCSWRGPVRDDIGESVEDAVTHAWPLWRELPVVPSLTDKGGQPLTGPELERALSQIDHAMPQWWFDGVMQAAAFIPASPLGDLGPPIRTHRGQGGLRHVPGRAPGGGYDMSAGEEPTIKVRKVGKGHVSSDRVGAAAHALWIASDRGPYRVAKGRKRKAEQAVEEEPLIRVDSEIELIDADEAGALPAKRRAGSRTIFAPEKVAASHKGRTTKGDDSLQIGFEFDW